MRVFTALWLVLFCLYLGLTQAEAKEKPPPDLYRIFTSFNDLESKIRAERWEDSLLALIKIDSDYKAMSPTLQPTVSAETNKKFTQLRASLQEKLASKDAEGAEHPYIQMQEFFLDIMGRYDYPAPPALMVAARYVKKAKAELAKKSVKEVVGEMEEIVELKGRILPALRSTGATDPDGFFEKVESVVTLAKGGKREEASKIIDELEGDLAPYSAK